MKKIKLKKVYTLYLLQILLQISFLILGINFESNSNVISTNFLSQLTKVQITGPLQNFIWCFTNNLSVLFIIFWLSYFTYGIVGTLWCINSSFVLGSIIKFSLAVNFWIAVIFILLEFIASITAVVVSTYIRFEKYKFTKFCEINYIDIDDERHKLAKKKREKFTLITLAVIAGILFVAAILEAVSLILIQ